jgi:hypothetical protein
MKIERFKTPKGYESGADWFQEFKQAHGLKFLGDGACATVYKGEKCAYKVGAVKDNKAYLAYVEAIAEYGIDNPFLPKIYGARIIGDFMIVALEELVDEFYNSDLKEKNGVSIYDLEEDVDLLATGQPSRNIGGTKGKDKHALKSAVYLIAALASKLGKNARLDMHSGNFMLRIAGDKKQVVITDPVVDMHI